MWREHCTVEFAKGSLYIIRVSLFECFCCTFAMMMKGHIDIFGIDSNGKTHILNCVRLLLYTICIWDSQVKFQMFNFSMSSAIYVELTSIITDHIF